MSSTLLSLWGELAVSSGMRLTPVGVAHCHRGRVAVWAGDSWDAPDTVRGLRVLDVARMPWPIPDGAVWVCEGGRWWLTGGGAGE